MKNTVITLATVLIFISIFEFSVSASNYHDVMKQNIEKMYKVKTVEELASISGTFYRVSEKEKAEWLPLYYASYSLVRVAFFTKDANVIHQYLDTAQGYLDQLKKQQPKESEVFALQGLLYSMRITSMSKGMKYSMLSNEELDKAQVLNDKNPRIYYCRGNNVFHTPSMFGGGKSKAKPIYEKAASLFKEDTSKIDFWPTWDSQHNNEMLKQCKED
ncbi:hypothetical protein [Labilibacter marinus]|uniref:hypothetical protein n=1 Tax=Labilibacter marinus TaxID=1477105 RepID=UPI00082C7B20|nr:hypothetical protein [Labilibacter marinus]